MSILTLLRERPALAISGASAVLLTTVLTGCSSSDSDEATVTSSPTPGSGDIVSLAKAFEATLSDDQKDDLNQDYSFENAQNWSNFPNALLTGGAGGGASGAPGGSSSDAPSGGMSGAPDGASGVPGGGASGAPSGSGSGAPTGGGVGGSSNSSGRVGVQTSSLSDNQWKGLKNLLAAATGSGDNEGYDEVLQHFDADDYLADNGGGDDYGRGNFFIAFLGEPTDSGTWELQFGGHHLAIANTYTDGKVAGATPSFRGIEPFTTVEENGNEVKPEQQEQEAFKALLTSMDSSQAATAKLDTAYNDILLGPGNDWAFPDTAEGVKGSDLTDEQQALLLAAINTYVDDVDDADAKTILAGYKSELDDTYVSYAGTTDMTEIGDYIRIDGPSVWIEFSMQNGVVLEGAHPHAVWRDKTNDYGGLQS